MIKIVDIMKRVLPVAEFEDPILKIYNIGAIKKREIQTKIMG